ncbi:MAG: hypothetical protein OHK006_07180 [Thermodesulfovibrionales bacterium]
MRPRRRHERFVRRLEVEFLYEGRTFRAITSDFSRYGLFIRTNRAFAPGTELDLVIHLPNNTTSRMRGLVRRALKTIGVMIKNGMGIELIRRDQNYINFLKECDPAEQEDAQPTEAPKTCHFTPPPQRHPQPGPEPRTAAHEQTAEPQQQAFAILACPSCGAKNKVPEAKIPLGPKCGRCKGPLTAQV